MREALRLLLTCVLALTAVAGCAASAPSPTSAPSVAATAAPAPPTVAAPTVVAAAPTVPPTVTLVPTTPPTVTPPPTAVPTKAAVATVAPTKAPIATSDVLNRMKSISAFSADFSTEADGQVTAGRMVLSGKRLRMDIENEGVKLAMFADEEKKTAYIYNAAEKKAMLLPWAEDTTNQSPREMFDWESTMTVPPKLLGEATVDGKSCLIYEFTTAKNSSKTWIDKANGFPIKSETTEDGQMVSSHYSNVVIGNVDESLLVLPPGTEILDMTGLVAGPQTPAAGSTPATVRKTATAVRGTATPARRSPTVVAATRTPARGTPTAVSSSAPKLSPTNIVGPVAPELKDNFKIPAGFRLVPDSGRGEVNIDTDIFKISAKWTGKATMQQLADFYSGLLADGWESQGGVVGQDTLEISFTQKDTDPEVQLDVQAEPGSGGTVLTLTISNGVP